MSNKDRNSELVIAWIMVVILAVIGFVANHYYLIYQLKMAKAILHGS
jgi:hypothetical protein